MGTLSELNGENEMQAIALLEPLIERAPEIAARVARRRPFQSADDLHQTIRQELLSLNEVERLSLFRAHPELAPDNPLAMTDASQSEQGRLNLTTDTNEYRDRLADLNAKYRSKFGFPFITALVRHPNMQSVLIEFEARLAKDSATEIEQAIDQVITVSSARVRAAFDCGKAEASRDAPSG
jgi:2-oxo-4-hydroxy-4-carboxy-5-ureidoimidazoline decarboxylase